MRQGAMLTLFVLILRAATGASVSGTVRDPQGQPVPSAVVEMLARAGGLKRVCYSDSVGAYRFDGIPAGGYLLRAQAPNFAVYVTEDLRLTSEAVRVVDIALQLGTLVQRVAVTASGTPQPLDEISKAMTIVDESDPARITDTDLADIVRDTSGVRVEQLGGPGAFTGIHLRGLRNEDTAVLVDGLRLRDAASTQADASGLIEDLLSTDTSRVEILRGSGSSLYGTNAIGGAINVLTGEGGGRTRGGILFEGGSLGLFRGRAQIAGGFHHDRVQYAAGISHLNVTEGVDGDDPYRDTAAQGRITFHLAPSVELMARIFGGDAFGKINPNPVSTGTLPAAGIVPAIPFSTFLPAPDDSDSTRAARFLSGAVRLSGQASPRLTYSVGYQLMTSGRRYGNGPAGSGFQPDGSTRSLFDGRIQTVNAQAGYQLGPFQLITAGYEMETETFATDSIDYAHPAANSAVGITERSHSLFVQDQVRLFGDRLQLSGAFRAQYFRLDTPSFDPAASAPYRGVSFASPPAAYTGDGSAAWFVRRSGTKLRAHVGRGYRTPSLFERFGAGFDPTFGYSVYGDPTIAPEHSIAFDAGIDQSFLRGRFRASATYFYTRLQNVIVFDFTGAINPATDPFGRSFGYRNTRGRLSRGFELEGSLSPISSLSITTAYTFTNGMENTPLVENVLRTFVIPRHQFSVVANQNIGRRLLVTFDMLASTNYLAPIFGTQTRAFQFDGVHKANLGASYRLRMTEQTATRLFVRAENISNQKYYEAGFATPDRTVSGGLRLEF